MKICKYYTGNYKHDQCFKFRGKEYNVHSIVRLTDAGWLFLGSKTKEVILTEQFTNWNGKLCWKYAFKSINITTCNPVDYSTDKTPDELIEEVIIPATAEYASREKLGVYSPVYKTGTKKVPNDWEIPSLRTGWLTFILCFIASNIFAGIFGFIISIVCCIVFGLYREAQIEAHTVYEHPEDDKIMRKKFDVLYGTKFSEENN